MTPLDRKRAGDAVAARIVYLGTTQSDVALKAGVDPNTLRALIQGQRWPRALTRDRIADALGWPAGEIARQAGTPRTVQLDKFTTVEIVGELFRRFSHG